MDDTTKVQELNRLQQQSLTDHAKLVELQAELARLGVDRLKTLKDHVSVSNELKAILTLHIQQQETLNASLADRLQLARDYHQALVDSNIAGHHGQLTQEASLEVSRLLVEQAQEKLKNERAAGTVTSERLKELIDEVKAAEDKYQNEKRLVKERKEALNQIKKSVPLVLSMATAASDMLHDFKTGNGDMAIKLMGEAAETLRESFKKIASQVTGGFEFSLKGLLDRMLELGLELDNIQQEFRRTTMLNESFAQSLEDTAASTAKTGVSMKEMSEAHMSLINNVSDFTLSSKKQRDSLAETAAVMSKLGVATEDFAQGVQASIKFFGQSMDQAEATQRELLAVAQELQVIPGELSAQFSKMSGSLAKLGDQGVGAFKELARISKITGMEMEKILQITDKFDTFEGAAEQVGKINAALGGNFVNAMDLMMDTDPASRFQKMRDAITGAGLSFDTMSYYQRKFFAESLGLSDVGDLALMLSGNMNMMQGATQKSAAEYEKMAEEAQAMQTVQEQFNSTIAAFFMENKDAIMDFMQMVRDLFQTFLDNIDNITKFVKLFVGLKVAMFTLSVLLPIIKGGLILYSAITGSAVIPATVANTIAQKGLAAGFTASGVAGKRAIGTLVGFAIVLAIVAAAMMIASPSKLVIALFGFAAAVFLIGRMSETSAVQIQALAIPLLQIGLAIGIAAAGIGLMALGFSLLSVDQMLGVGMAILLIAHALYTLIPALAGAGTISATVSGPLIALGAAFLLIGAGVGIAAAGIGYMAEGFSLLFNAIDMQKLTVFNAFMTTLASMTGVYAIVAIGMKALGVGITSFGAGLNFVDGEKLKSIADFAMGLAGLQTGALAELAFMLEKVAEAMEGIPESKAVALTATMQAASIAAEAAESLAGNRGGGGGKGGGGKGGSGQRSRPFEVKFILDGEVFERKVIRIFEMEDGKFHAEAGRNER